MLPTDRQQLLFKYKNIFTTTDGGAAHTHTHKDQGCESQIATEREMQQEDRKYAAQSERKKMKKP